MLTICLAMLLCSCSTEREQPQPPTVESGSYLPPLASLRGTSEVSGQELTDDDPVSSANFNALRHFTPTQSNPLAFAVYEYLTDFQPARVSVTGLGCDYYVFIANFAEQRWQLVASVEAENESTQVTADVWDDSEVWEVRDTWIDYYSASGAVYVAVVTLQSGYLQSLVIENSRDIALKCISIYQQAEDDYYAATGEYFQFVPFAEPYLDLQAYNFLRYESRNLNLGCWAYVVNALKTDYDLAVAFTRRNSGCGYIYVNAAGASAETQEALNQFELISREACKSIGKQEAAYFAANGMFGDFDELRNPPQGQLPYLDERYFDGADIGMGMIVFLFSAFADSYEASCGHPNYVVWFVDETGELHN